MNKTLLISITILTSCLLFALSSCDKSKHKMEVVKDCTGVYLRNSNGQDYFVCNEEILSDHANGTKVKVRIDELTACFGLIEPPSCSEAHTNEGVIEITEIF